MEEAVPMPERECEIIMPAPASQQSTASPVIPSLREEQSVICQPGQKAVAEVFFQGPKIMVACLQADFTKGVLTRRAVTPDKVIAEATCPPGQQARAKAAWAQGGTMDAVAFCPDMPAPQKAPEAPPPDFEIIPAPYHQYL